MSDKRKMPQLTRQQKVGAVKAVLRYIRDRDANLLARGITALLPAWIVSPIDDVFQLASGPLALADEVVVALIIVTLGNTVFKRYSFSEHPEREGAHD